MATARRGFWTNGNLSSRKVWRIVTGLSSDLMLWCIFPTTTVRLTHISILCRHIPQSTFYSSSSVSWKCDDDSVWIEGKNSICVCIMANFYGVHCVNNSFMDTFEVSFLSKYIYYIFFSCILLAPQRYSLQDQTPVYLFFHTESHSVPLSSINFSAVHVLIAVSPSTFDNYLQFWTKYWTPQKSYQKSTFSW